MAKKFKIVTDSSADMDTFEGVDFASAPLKIITANKEYIDDENLNVEEMVNDLRTYKGKSSTSCPNTEDWIEAFGDAERIFCITITATLSGSYNSACRSDQISTAFWHPPPLPRAHCRKSVWRQAAHRGKGRQEHRSFYRRRLPPLRL